MTATLATTERTNLFGVVLHAISGIWGAVTGIAPHVLHHVGPLAGAAVLAGAGGQILFFSLGLAAATPMLIRLHKRFQTWLAPTIAIGLFAVTFTLSTIFIGPLITGSESTTTGFSPVTTTTDQHGH